MLALTERLDHVLGRRGDVDSDHVEPWGHDLVHPRVGEGEHAEQHVALGGAEGGLERTRRRHQAVKTAVYPGEQPQEQAEGGEGPARER